MPADTAFPSFLAEDRKRLVERLKRWGDDPDSEPEIETWYNESYRPNMGKGAIYSGRLLPRMQWELEWDSYSVMYDVGRSLERQDRPEEALDIYNAILKDFIPRGMAYYERPAIILERMRRYDEAIVICERAIKVIEAELFRADAEPFKQRKARLLRKKERREH